MKHVAILFLALSISACGTAEDIPEESFQEDCASTHELVGTTTALNSYAHGVEGNIEVVDDCTIRINNFTFDGGGIDVRIFGSDSGDFTADGFAISNDIFGTAYDNETLEVPLPEGVSLDDINHLSVWCVAAGQNFGDAELGTE